MKKFILFAILSCFAFASMSYGDEYDAKALVAAMHVKKTRVNVQALQGASECLCVNCTCATKTPVTAEKRYAWGGSQQGFVEYEGGPYVWTGTGYMQVNHGLSSQFQRAVPAQAFGNCANGQCGQGLLFGGCANGQCGRR